MKIAYYKEFENELQRVILEVDDDIFNTAKRVVRLTKNLCLIFNDEVKEEILKNSVTIINLVNKCMEPIKEEFWVCRIKEDKFVSIKDKDLNLMDCIIRNDI